MTSNQQQQPSLAVQIALAGASNCAAVIFTNPVDAIKVRMQLHGETALSALSSSSSSIPRSSTSILHTLRAMLSETGFGSLYRGIVPSLLREASYGGIRIGLYESIKGMIVAAVASSSSSSSTVVITTGSNSASTSSFPSTLPPLAVPPPLPVASISPEVPFSIRFLAGAVSGMIGAMLTNPADLLKVRLQAANNNNDHQKQQQQQQQQQQKKIIGESRRTNPLLTIITTELQDIRTEWKHIRHTEGGIVGLWQGSGPNILRAALVTAAQVGSYDSSKTLLKKHTFIFKEEGVMLHIAASMLAGFTAAVVTSPVDVVKSRLMAQRARLRRTTTLLLSPPIHPYNGMLDCFGRTIQHEGVLGLYKGFNAQWLRIGPHTALTFLVYEQLRKVVGMKPV